MKRKILAHIVSLLVGLFFGYYSWYAPILLPNSTYWSFLQEYWWLVLISLGIGYGLTFLIFWIFNRNRN